MCKSTIQQCLCCSKDILVNSDNPNRKFCDRDCYDLYRSAAIENRAPKCKCCGKKIIKIGNSKKVYCSKKCRDDLAIINCRKTCNVCGVDFSAIKWLKSKDGFRVVRDKEKKLCSEECFSEFMKTDEDRKKRVGRAGKDHNNWQGGSHRGGKRGDNWLQIAEKCRELHGRVCRICGKTEEENGRKLDVNHIIPFHQHRNKTAANKQSNLEALCRSCHTKTDWEYRKNNPTQILLDIFA